MGSTSAGIGGEKAAGRAVGVTADVDVEAMMFGQRERFTAEMPLADIGGAVTGLTKRFGERELLEGQTSQEASGAELGFGIPTAGGKPVGEQQARGILAGKDGGARGRTEGAGGVSIGEAHAIAGELVDMRGLIVRTPVGADVAPADIVDQEEHDVEFVGGRRRRGGAKPGGRSEEQRNQKDR